VGLARPDFGDRSIHSERVGESSGTQFWNLYSHNHRHGNGSFKFAASDCSDAHSKSCFRRSEFSCVQPQYTHRRWYSYGNGYPQRFGSRGRSFDYSFEQQPCGSSASDGNGTRGSRFWHVYGDSVFGYDSNSRNSDRDIQRRFHYSKPDPESAYHCSYGLARSFVLRQSGHQQHECR